MRKLTETGCFRNRSSLIRVPFFLGGPRFSLASRCLAPEPLQKLPGSQEAVVGFGRRRRQRLPPGDNLRRQDVADSGQSCFSVVVFLHTDTLYTRMMAEMVTKEVRHFPDPHEHSQPFTCVAITNVTDKR